MELLLFLLAMSVDSFAVGLSYRVNGIRIPPLSAVIMSAVGAAAFGLAASVSGLISSVAGARAARLIGAAVLFAMGVHSLSASFFKALLRRCGGRKSLDFTVGGLSFAAMVCLDETVCDLDGSKELSPREALPLSVALSADSVAVGLGLCAPPMTTAAAVVAAFLSGLAAIAVGSLAGKALLRRGAELSWLTGVMLIALAAGMI